MEVKVTRCVIEQGTQTDKIHFLTEGEFAKIYTVISQFEEAKANKDTKIKELQVRISQLENYILKLDSLKQKQ